MKKVIITREESQGKKTAKLLQKYGLEAVLFPTIKFKQLKIPQEKVKNADIVVFTSQNGVKFFMKQLSPEILKGKIVIATGEKTGKKLAEYSINNYLLPDRYDSIGVAQLIKNSKHLREKTVAVIRPREGIDTGLKMISMFAKVEIIPAYETVINFPENAEEIKRQILSGEIDYIIFTSPSTFINFTQIFPKIWKKLLKKLKIGVIGTTTAAALEKKGVKPDIIPEKFTVEELIKKIKQQVDQT